MDCKKVDVKMDSCHFASERCVYKFWLSNSKLRIDQLLSHCFDTTVSWHISTRDWPSLILNHSHRFNQLIVDGYKYSEVKTLSTKWDSFSVYNVTHLYSPIYFLAVCLPWILHWQIWHLICSPTKKTCRHKQLYSIWNLILKALS